MEDELKQRIVDCALALGTQQGWEAVRLHQIAETLGIGLDDIQRYFREKEDVVEAWFDSADTTMLRIPEQTDFLALSPRERVHRLIMGWLDALSPHRKVTREMIYGKFEPGHLHIQIPGLMRVSRTVQWIREAARRDAVFHRRALEETVLTSIYLMTFFRWMRDESTGATETARFLDQCLRLAERLPAGILAR